MGRAFGMGCNPTMDWRERFPTRTRNKMTLVRGKSLGAGRDGGRLVVSGLDDYRLTKAENASAAPAIITQSTPNNRTCLLQFLQTLEGHQGTLAMRRKPMFPNQPTEPRSLSGFSRL
jgi:hypothetical protein